MLISNDRFLDHKKKMRDPNLVRLMTCSGKFQILSHKSYALKGCAMVRDKCYQQRSSSEGLSGTIGQMKMRTASAELDSVGIVRDVISESGVYVHVFALWYETSVTNRDLHRKD